MLRVAFAALACTMPAGCASLLAPGDAGFGDVRKTVADRAGVELCWDRAIVDEGRLPPAAAKLLDQPLTAKRAVQVALFNNRRLQAVYEELGIARAALIQAGLLRNPVVEGSLKLHGGGDVLEFAVVQDLVSLLFIPLRRARAGAALEEAKQRVAAEAIALAAHTRIGYYRVAAARQIVAARRDALTAAEAGYDAARRLREAGNITALRLAQERARYEEARLSVSASEAMLLRRREALNRLLGLYGADASWQIGSAMPPPPEAPLDLDRLEARAVTASLDIAMARARIAAVAKELGIARGRSLIPDLGFGAEGEREADGALFAGPLLEFALPVFDWGQGARPRARARLRRAWRNYTATAVEVRSAARSGRERYRLARAQALHHGRVLVPLRRRITRETQFQFNAMQVGVFHLLAAKRQEIAARERAVNSLCAYWEARVRLQQLLAGSMAGGGAQSPGGEADGFASMGSGAGH